VAGESLFPSGVVRSERQCVIQDVVEEPFFARELAEANCAGK
jgi:hypothetical protein